MLDLVCSELKRTQLISSLFLTCPTHKLQDGRQVIRGSEGQWDHRSSGVLHLVPTAGTGQTTFTGRRRPGSSSVVSNKSACPVKCCFFFFLAFASSVAVSDSQLNFELWAGNNKSCSHTRTHVRTHTHMRTHAPVSAWIDTHINLLHIFSVI